MVKGIKKQEYRMVEFVDYQFLRVQDVADLNQDYETSIFLTFDIDWANDHVLDDTLNILERYDIGATFFVTHETKLLDRLRENPKMELGIHPNFNFLLNGDFRYGKNYIEVVDYYKRIVPEAVSARSHSLVQSSNILQAFHNVGIQYDLNLLIDFQSGIELKPVPHHFDNFERLPYFWEDDTHMLSSEKPTPLDLIKRKGLKILDFHPIHVYLNSEKIDRYNEARPYLKDIQELKAYRNKRENGTRDFLTSLIELAFKKNKVHSVEIARSK